MIGVGLGKPPIVPTGVIGVIAVGVDGSAVRSAKAQVPFLATLTGQGVVQGAGNPLIVMFKVMVPSGGQPLEQVSVTVAFPGIVGVPVMLPFVVLIVKPAGRLPITPKLVGFWFV